jgi:predicted RNA-binding protein with PIN domain
MEAVGSWLVDGNNVLGARPDGWWRDRPAARRRLVAELAAFASATGGEVTVVFDGREVPEEVAAGTEAGVAVAFAPGGRDAADHVIAARIEAGGAPLPTVVTSDRALAARVQAAGATVVGAAGFRRQLDEHAGR